VADYFVICSGTNKRQIRTIANDVRLKMKELGALPMGAEGYEEAAWILMDFADVVVHIFSDEARAYYDLELLWGDAPRLEWEAEVVPAATAP